MAANDYTKTVTRYFRRKNANGFEEAPVRIGAEQRYVTSLRNSSNNNLEEQYLLGTDSYTEVYQDQDENIIVEKSFHINSDDPSFVYSDYYKIVTTVYKDAIEDRSFYFDGDQLIMPNDINKVIFGDGSESYPDLTAMYGVDKSMFRFSEDSFEIYPSEDLTVRKDELFFIKNGGNDVIPVLTKTISKRVIQDPSGNDRIVYKEDIENHLIEP